MSSCCGGNCGSGSGCKCGNGCGGCKMSADLSYSEKATTETMVLGFATEKTQYGVGAVTIAPAIHASAVNEEDGDVFQGPNKFPLRLPERSSSAV